MREATRHHTRKNDQIHTHTYAYIRIHTRVQNDHRMSYGPVAGHGVGDGRRVPYDLSRGTACKGGRCVPYGPLSSGTACKDVSSRAVWPVAGSRAVWSVAGSRAVWPVAGSRLVTSLRVSVTSVSLPCLWSCTPKARRLPCPGPTAACSRRRQRRFTNMYSFVVPWRFIMARSAARLRRIVGPLSSHKAVAGQTPQPDITGNNRTSSEHIPGISGHFRASSDTK